MHVAHEAKREPSTSTAHAMCAESVVETAASAVRKIAPLWSLQNFVAVNPYLAFTDRSFGDTAEVMARVAGARVTMRRELYLNALAEGRIQQRDLDAALDEASSNRTEFGTSARLLRRCAGPGWNPERLRLRTVADVASELTGRNWSRQVTDRISFWAAAHFDRGQSMWRSLPQ